MEIYKNPSLPVQQRVRDLLEKMTLQEKIAQMDMIRGVELATKTHEAFFCAVDEQADFYWDKVEEAIGETGIGFVHDIYSVPAVLNKLQAYFVEKTRLGIPCLFTGEALHGICAPGASIFPMPVNMAATFDRQLVKKVGQAIAAETRTLGMQEILAPNLDLAREIRWGRVEETFGEDTYLASEMAYAIITGEQQDGYISRHDAVVCEPKHYVVHGIAEGGTNCAPARAGMREIETCYLPVFEAGVQRAGAYNAMASYNCIDGEAVICSDYYLRDILKQRYGMRGYVRADFGAVNKLKVDHHITGTDEDSICLAVNAGLDVQGFDYPNTVWQDTLLQLVQDGRISMETIDDAVSRILTVKFEAGLFEHPYTDEERYKTVVRCDAHKAVSYETAQKSVTLLKNEGALLPLDKHIPSIALIGPSSSRQRIGGYSSVPYGYTIASVYDEMKKMVGENTVIRQCDGCSISESDVPLIPESWFPEGLTLEFYNNMQFQGEAVDTTTARQVSFNWVLAKPHRALNFKGYSVRIKGVMQVDTYQFVQSEQFTGRLVFTAQDSVRVKLDGKTVIESFGENKQQVPQCTFTFMNGRKYNLEIELVVDVSGNRLNFGLDYSCDSMEQAVELARQCDVTVLVCGDDTATSGEGMDRCDIRLYGRQRELVKRVCALQKPVVLVLEHGKPVDLSFESQHIPAIISAWFGGEFGAKAICDVLFGNISPSGKLPISFPRSVGHLPCYYSKLPGSSVGYLEGSKSALYPFGHGLSYSQFTYSGLHIQKDAGQYAYTVTCKVQNTGDMEAEEVVQLYVQDNVSSVVTPDKLLKGFERIHLVPGEETIVTFRLGFESFRLLNGRMEWIVEPGEFQIFIGSSSEDIRLSDSLFIEA